MRARDVCGEGQRGQLSPVPTAAGAGGAVTAPPGTQPPGAAFTSGSRPGDLYSPQVNVVCRGQDCVWPRHPVKPEGAAGRLQPGGRRVASECDRSRVGDRRLGGCVLCWGSLGVLLLSGVLLGRHQPQWPLKPPQARALSTPWLPALGPRW